MSATAYGGAAIVLLLGVSLVERAPSASSTCEAFGRFYREGESFTLSSGEYGSQRVYICTRGSWQEYDGSLCQLRLRGRCDVTLGQRNCGRPELARLPIANATAIFGVPLIRSSLCPPPLARWTLGRHVAFKRHVSGRIFVTIGPIFTRTRKIGHRVRHTRAASPAVSAMGHILERRRRSSQNMAEWLIRSDEMTLPDEPDGAPAFPHPRVSLSRLAWRSSAIRQTSA
jgi:hypothetical protein